MKKVYDLLLIPITIIYNRVKIFKVMNICFKNFLPVEQELIVHCGKVIGIVKHGQNNEHVNSKLDLFVYKVEKIENLFHIHCNFDGFDRIMVVNQDYLKYIKFYEKTIYNSQSR